MQYFRPLQEKTGFAGNLHGLALRRAFITFFRTFDTMFILKQFTFVAASLKHTACTGHGIWQESIAMNEADSLQMHAHS